MDDVRAFLEERLSFAVGEGISEHRVVLDPGIGFGKTVAHNLELLRRLGEIVVVGRPVLVGTSRKSFLGVVASAKTGVHARARGGVCGRAAACGRAPARHDRHERDGLASEELRCFRVHDVAPVADALAVAAATLSGKWKASPTTT